MISEELSRSNERVRAVERRNEQLRQEIERIKVGTGEADKLEEMERRQQESDDENRRLASLLEEESRRSAKAVEDMSKRNKEVETQHSAKEKEIVALRKRLQSMTDYDEIKRELEIFKYVEFAVEADRQLDDHGDEDAAEVKTSTKAQPLEALLIEKNRHLQNEVTNWRVANTELDASSSHTKKALEQAGSEIERLKTLNERLEDDLINLKPNASRIGSPAKGMSAEEALAEMDKIAEGTKEGIAATASASPKPQAAPIPFDAAKEPNAAKATANSASSAASILPIITSQRDRFRARNAELEEELRKQFDTISELRGEVKTLQADNLGLYEKMRYLQAYGSSNANGASQNFRGPAGGSRAINISARNDPASYPPNSRGEDKYKDKYEAAMNPFEQFRGRVSGTEVYTEK
jgi:homeobox protein cut-like